ncbi:sugar transferase [Streptococcus hongkongensis]|nr:galactosyl transferase [Streptococcus uberis]
MEEKEKIHRLFVMIVQSIMILIALFLTSLLVETNVDKNFEILIVLITHVIVFNMVEFYKNFKVRGFLQEFLLTIKYCIYYLLVLTFFFFIFKLGSSISRYSTFIFLIFIFILLYTIDIILKCYLKYAHLRIVDSPKVIVITNKKRHAENLKLFKKSSEINFVGFCVLDYDYSESSLNSNDGILMIDYKDFFSIITKLAVDQVFINLPLLEYDIYDIPNMIENLELMGITVNVNIDTLDFESIGDKKIQTFNGYSVITFSTKFHKYSHLFAKRTIDIFGAIIGLFICLVFSIFIVPAIKCDGGPAIFVQKRVGRNGRIFNFYKFRSMHIDADKMKKDLISKNQMDGLMFKMDNDPRITKVGHFIRKTSIDELPQFYNVLKGDMSLVGTRPPTLDEYNHYSPKQKRRLSFKPGITGLWQVSGRSNITNFDEIVALDVKYINEWTIWSDIKILLLTIKVVVFGDGAK